MSVRDSYVAHFGEDEAVALEQAAAMHDNAVHPNRGSDPFKWAVLIAVGYDCVEQYAESHGITVPYGAFIDWAQHHGELASHDGDVDYLSLFLGSYNDLIGVDE